MNEMDLNRQKSINLVYICYMIVNYNIIVVTNIYYVHIIIILVIYFVTSILKFFSFDITEYLSHYNTGSTGVKKNIINIILYKKTCKYIYKYIYIYIYIYIVY